MDLTFLQRELARFDATVPIEAARTPPTSWYLDPAMLAAEFAGVFANRWHFAARTSQLASAGSFVALEIGDQPIVVVRGDDDQLRAFHNVCRHHAACIASGEGSTEVLTCPYHGWSYRLDGTLKSAPGMGQVLGFRRDRMSLPEASVTEWGPFVFVCLGEKPPDLHAELEPLRRMLDATGWQDLHYTGSASYTLDCNWKVFIDNYLDGGYHIAHAHKGLAAELDLDGYTTRCYDTWSTQNSPDSGGDRVSNGAIYAWLHPNFMINRYGPIMDTNLVLPVGHDRCEVRNQYFFLETEGAQAERFIEESLAATDAVQREDIDLCANVQRGLRSTSYDSGVYAKSETSMLLFHQLLSRDLGQLLT
ncbi:MAG: SRPBCC family protein [Planctomycetota bacterium]|nr:SRPBCC family protein [Planctomycetota bacterium]